MNIVIRQATAADAVLIAEFNALMAKETEDLELDRERLRKGTKALSADPSKGIYYIAEADGTMAGQLMITYEWSDWRNATFWWIQSVYVLPAYRKHGIFRTLYRFVESLARSRGDVCGLRLYVDQSNTRAQQTYAALGMKPSHYQIMDMDIELR
ncbi:MAG: GNAT family N-acetyltransferase [Ignavibacteriae bacterium]|nr:MAG: GNAT family N-acetyltransferase [Ignavibacteriota bacterium]